VVGLTLTEAEVALEERGLSWQVRVTGPPGKNPSGQLRVIQTRVIGPAQVLLVCAHYDAGKGG
jgi:hypothetical protein